MDHSRARSRSHSPRHRSHKHGREDERGGAASRPERGQHGRSERRSRSPRRHKTSAEDSVVRRRERTERSRERPPKAELPFESRHLSKGDIRTFEPLLAHYLEIQKGKFLESMDDREVKGRWKSFVGKWNRGELAEGWYDPDMFTRICSMERPEKPPHELDTHNQTLPRSKEDGGSYQSDDEDYGPALPISDSSRRAGAAIPKLQDLSLRNEMIAEDREVEKSAGIAAIRDARRADRKHQKEQLDEILPRAEAGTHERKLEKKQMVNDKMKEFREKSPGMDGGMNEKELMGGGDSLDDYKRQKQAEQRKRTEREIRREEIDRAKREEVEEKRRAWKEKEDEKISMLKELAKQRFG